MNKNFKRAVVAVAVTAMCTGSYAGFMDDFYNSAGAAANITSGGVVQSQGGTFVTGGSVTWRAPLKSFTPFNFQAPSAKAGCGGLDFFAGSFGFPNSAEFVNFLRNVGQNSLGLFFQLAIKSLTPLLGDTIKEIADDIQKMNSMLGNSCQAAQSLVNATGWPEKVAQKQTGNEVAQGTGGSGWFDSYNNFKTNLGNALSVTTPAANAANSGGSPAGEVPHNVTWLALNSGALSGVNAEYKNVVMSLVGTKIYEKDPNDASAPRIRSIGRLAKFELKSLAGRWSTTPAPLTVYECPDDITNKCIGTDFDQAGQINNYKPLARKAYESMVLIRDAIQNRQELFAVSGGEDAVTLLGATRLPAFRVLELTSSPTMAAVSNVFIQKYADLIGLELTVNFVETMVAELRASITDAKKYAVNGISLDDNDVGELIEKLSELQLEAATIRAELDRVNGSEDQLVRQMASLEQYINTSFNMRLMDNLRYSKGI